MMKRPLVIRVSGLKQGENVIELEHQPEDLGLESREVAENPLFERLVGPLRERVVIVRDGNRLLVRGRVRFRARLECAVCGVEHERDFDEELAAAIHDQTRAGAGRRGLDRNDADEVVVVGDALNLAPVVRDAVHLAIPIAPSCRPDCRGVCPRCGANLNAGACGCG
jgi:uncharacterized protein